MAIDAIPSAKENPSFTLRCRSKGTDRTASSAHPASTPLLCYAKPISDDTQQGGEQAPVYAVAEMNPDELVGTLVALARCVVRSVRRKGPSHRVPLRPSLPRIACRNRQSKAAGLFLASLFSEDGSDGNYGTDIDAQMVMITARTSKAPKQIKRRQSVTAFPALSSEGQL